MINYSQFSFFFINIKFSFRRSFHFFFLFHFSHFLSFSFRWKAKRGWQKLLKGPKRYFYHAGLSRIVGFQTVLWDFIGSHSSDSLDTILLLKLNSFTWSFMNFRLKSKHHQKLHYLVNLKACYLSFVLFAIFYATNKTVNSITEMLRTDATWLHRINHLLPSNSSFHSFYVSFCFPPKLLSFSPNGKALVWGDWITRRYFCFTSFIAFIFISQFFCDVESLIHLIHFLSDSYIHSTLARRLSFFSNSLGKLKFNSFYRLIQFYFFSFSIFQRYRCRTFVFLCWVIPRA